MTALPDFLPDLPEMKPGRCYAVWNSWMTFFGGCGCRAVFLDTEFTPPWCVIAKRSADHMKD
jgi:hypothetical protein